MKGIENKVALVTGAASGIGKATAIRLGALNAKVMVTDLNEQGALETVNAIETAGGYAKYFHLDVSKKEEIDRVISQIFSDEKALDFAINNAGIGGKLGPMHEVKPEDWDRMMAINLSGLFYCMQAQIKYMLQQGSGGIVNISSVAGLNGVALGSPYSAAKHGVIGLSKSAAQEYGSRNIRVNTVCPGFTQTEIIEGVPDKVLDFTTKFRVPMRRLGQPEEIASAIIWLLSEESSFVNGHSMILDGGYETS